MEGAQRKTPSRGPPGAAASGEWWGPSRPQDVPSEGNGSSRLACCGSHGAESGSPLSLRRLPAAATGLGQARGPSARALAARGESQQAWGERPHHELLPEAGRSGVGPPLPPRSAADQQRSQTAARPQEPPSHVSDDGGLRHGARGASRMQTWFRPPAGCAHPLCRRGGRVMGKLPRTRTWSEQGCEPRPAADGRPLAGAGLAGHPAPLWAAVRTLAFAQGDKGT